MDRETIIFDGRAFHRWPNHAKRHRRVYYWAHRGSLHRAIWEKANGPIPPKHFIHHVDHNPLNNDLANLALVAAGEHTKLHWAERQPGFLICEHCGDDFRSRAWAGERYCSNACKAAARRESGVDNEQRTCTTCGAAFEANKYTAQRFCSPECAPRGTYERPTVQFSCEECGTRSVSASPLSRFCTAACRKRHGRRLRARVQPDG